MKRFKKLRPGLFRIGAAASLFFAAAGSVMAAMTYYVSPSGSDINAGTLGAPFKTIQKAANIVNPGDTVIVRDGVYTGGSFAIVSLTRSGTPANWITFRAEHKWGAVLDGERQGDSDPSNDTEILFNMSGAGYIRIEDFELRNGKDHGFFASNSASNIYMYGNKVHDIGRYPLLCSDTSSVYGNTGLYAGYSVT
jgi:hypothetical protein